MEKSLPIGCFNYKRHLLVCRHELHGIVERLEVSEDEKVFVTPSEMKFFPKQPNAEEEAAESVHKIGASARETIMAVS